jgi:hypothetical protein
MPDSGADNQDGAETVDKARFDNLMGAYQKAKARADALEAQGQTATDSPEYEIGVNYTMDPETGTMVVAEAPTPRGTNGPRGPKPQVDDLEALRADIAGGRPSRPDNGWF